MKKVVLLLIASLAFCGSMFAQQQYESHWPDFNPDVYEPYENNSTLVAFIKIDGEYVSGTYNYEALEVGCFVGDVCRGHHFLSYYPDKYPILEGSVHFTNSGEEVSFKLYDHSDGNEYDIFTSNIPILTGEDHIEIYFGNNYEDAVVLSFFTSMPTFTKDITGYNAGGGYYLIASPIGDVNPGDVDQIFANTYDLYRFNQAATPDSEGLAKEWENYRIHQSDFNLVSGCGYLYANSNNVTLTFTGLPYNGNGVVALVKNVGQNTTTNLEGWNLVGNPFAETAYIADGRSFYKMNDTRTNLMEGSGAIPAMEGVFVLAETDGENMTFTTTEPAAGGSKLALNLSQNRSVIDRAVIRFGEGRTLPKLQLNPNSTKVYISQDNEDYAVVRGEDMGEMPVNFKAAENGTYTLAINSEEVSFSYLHLIDNMTGADVDLLQNPSYTFDANTTDYASRFKLVFATGDASEDSFAFNSNGVWVINNDGKAILQVVDVMGRILKCEQIEGCHNLNLKAAPGVYMFQLIKGNDVKVQKVVVK